MTSVHPKPVTRILTIGECMTELAPSGTPDNYDLGFAGDTFNTAWYIARLRKDIAVSFFSAVGTDAISQRMREFIASGGVGVDHMQTVSGKTVGLYLITLDEGERSFTYWRKKSAASALADNPAALARAFNEADIIYFSGVTLGILNVTSRETFLDALRAARQNGKTIVFDPNLRPQIWASSEEMTETIMLGAAVSELALPSFEDESSWFGDANPESTAERYLSGGVSTVIVKNGSDPVFYQQDGERGEVAVPVLQAIVDTTAAGDSFNAAILADLRDQAPISESILRACKLAGQVVQGKGALVPVNLENLQS